MRLTLLAAGTAVGLALALSSGAQAASLGLLGTSTAQNQSLAQSVDWRERHERCEHERRECAERWGFRSWRYRRCVVAHRCG